MQPATAVRETTVTYRTAGDGSTVARIVLPDGRVIVHSSGIRSRLEKLVRERYPHAKELRSQCST